MVLKYTDGRYPDIVKAARDHGHEELAEDIEHFIK